MQFLQSYSVEHPQNASAAQHISNAVLYNVELPFASHPSMQADLHEHQCSGSPQPPPNHPAPHDCCRLIPQGGQFEQLRDERHSEQLCRNASASAYASTYAHENATRSFYPAILKSRFDALNCGFQHAQSSSFPLNSARFLNAVAGPNSARFLSMMLQVRTLHVLS